MKRLRPAFVLTVSTLSASATGCDSGSAKSPDGTNHEQSSSGPGSEQSSTSAAASSKEVTIPKSGNLNPVDAKGNRLFKSSDGTCYIELPFKEPPKSVVPPPTEKVACPAALSDPAWNECAFGEIYAENETSAECTCHVFGNPPPPPKKLACPKR